MPTIKVKSFGKRQKQALAYLYRNEKIIDNSPILHTVLTALESKGLIVLQNGQGIISERGRKVVETQLSTQLSKTPSTQRELSLQLLQLDNDTSLKDDATPEILKTEEFKTSKSEALLLQFLSNGPQPINQLRKVKRLVPALKDRGLLEISDNELRISAKGQLALEQAIKSRKTLGENEDLSETFLSSKKIQSQKRLHRKSNEFLELYKQNLTYQQIGEIHGVSRERVRQILTLNSAFHAYLNEFEAAKKDAEKEKLEQAKQKQIKNSLASLYPERIAELWDHEKNGDLKPENVLASSTLQYIWLRCPVDDHSWRKKVRDIVFYSWERIGTSGCPICAGKTKKPEKQASLAESYVDYVLEYWDFEKNESLSLSPEKVTTGSNKKAWFRCPKDGYEWQAVIAATITQQWSKSNPGCKVCNGTHLRKIGAWGKAGSLIETYPEEVAKYWDYARNDRLKLDPSVVTTGSPKKAWFQCPLDNFEWQANVSGITSGSWKQGRSGCPICGRGWTIESIRQFVMSLEHHIPNLTQSERYKIFEQAGVLGTKNVEGLKLVKDIIKGKLAGQKLHAVLQGNSLDSSENAPALSDKALDANAELNDIDYATHTISLAPSPQNSQDESENEKETEAVDLPAIRVQKSLEFLSSKIVASSDDEAIEFFIASRRNRIWAEVFENQSAVDGLLSFSDDGYGRQVRDQFLDEYNQANNMQNPLGWSFRVNGKITPPNLMQKVAAVRLRNQKRMLNLSLRGCLKSSLKPICSASDESLQYKSWFRLFPVVVRNPCSSDESGSTIQRCAPRSNAWATRRSLFVDRFV